MIRKGCLMVIAFLKWLNENVEKYMVALLFIAFSGIMMLNVVTRYVFGNAISWASEVVLLMFCLVRLVCNKLCLQRKSAY